MIEILYLLAGIVIGALFGYMLWYKPERPVDDTQTVPLAPQPEEAPVPPQPELSPLTVKAKAAIAHGREERRKRALWQPTGLTSQVPVVKLPETTEEYQRMELFRRR